MTEVPTIGKPATGHFQRLEIDGSCLTQLLQQLSGPVGDLAFQLQHVAQYVGWGVVVHRFGGDGFVASSGEAPVVLFDLGDGYSVAIGAFFSLLPLG